MNRQLQGILGDPGTYRVYFKVQKRNKLPWLPWLDGNSDERDPKKKQNGSLWGGEFSAKIFLKHWYLQCFPAMKALKPLF